MLVVKDEIQVMETASLGLCLTERQNLKRRLGLRR